MNKYFVDDAPIETSLEDLLGIKPFSKHLANALVGWDRGTSLVVAVNGRWGTGKSSVLNLACKEIELIKEDDPKNKNVPIIVRFNPWSISEKKNLSAALLDELKEGLKLCKKTNKVLIQKLERYRAALDLVPDQKELAEYFSKILIVFGILGYSLSQSDIFDSLTLSSILNIAGKLSIGLGICKGVLGWTIKFLQKRFPSKDGLSISALKEEIVTSLKLYDKKMVVVIDDVDRLGKSEIRELVRLIRVNADFPNIIYLLLFDRAVIEKHLEGEAGISGRDYLEKIVQVSFDMPVINKSKLRKILARELQRVLAILPSPIEFSLTSNRYWVNVFNSGFKGLFRNIRDIKRFVNGLAFNITQMQQKGTMEVNVVDFIAIEAIRLFSPELYHFMRDKKTFFTSTSTDFKEERKEELDAIWKICNTDLQECLLELIKRLFPQINYLLSEGSSHYGDNWQAAWSTKLRVCAKKNFDSYFTLVPGGSEDSISQFEINSLLATQTSVKSLEEKIREHIKNDRGGMILDRLQDFVYEKISVPNNQFVLQAIFNISDELCDEPIDNLILSNPGIPLWGITHKMLKRVADKKQNFDVLVEAIDASTGLYGPVYVVAMESPIEEDPRLSEEYLVSDKQIKQLQQLCVVKIIQQADCGDLIAHPEFQDILYRWKAWDKEKKWQAFCQKTLGNAEDLLLLSGHFLTYSATTIVGDAFTENNVSFDYKNLQTFVDIKGVHREFLKIKKGNPDLYREDQEVIDMFLDKFPKDM